MGRILGLDVGDRRIGLAISTPEGRLAVPLRVQERTDDASDLQRIAALARAEDVGAFVVGLPRSLDGSIGLQARVVEAFARRLGEAAALPVELWDERLTSVQAKRSIRELRGRRRPSDDIAAAIILQAYLDRQQHT